MDELKTIRAKLRMAQDLLSDVYHYACQNGLEDLERQMSVADGCIIDGVEAVDKSVDNFVA